MQYRLFTSESVCSGHPDKICDQISDSILDECLKQDSESRVAVETLVTTNKIVLAGEISTKAKVDFEKIARNTVKKLGYTEDYYNFDYKNCDVEVLVHEQSADIAQGVKKLGAGDQGMMFGFATSETLQLMPLPIALAHEITKNIDKARNTTKLKYLRPDGKAQVTVGYKNGKPQKVTKVITAVPHDPKISREKVAKDIYNKVIISSLKKYGYTVNFSDTICNGTGKWEVGGPHADAGLTGRKTIVDSYGSMAKIGGGCFSGKDPTKVDRSAAYAARFIAKNIVAKKLAKICEVQLSYAIGKPRPISKSIDTFGTETVSISKIEKKAWNIIDLSVSGIIKKLNLRKPIYEKTAVNGHFGNKNFPREKIVKSL